MKKLIATLAILFLLPAMGISADLTWRDRLMNLEGFDRLEIYYYSLSNEAEWGFNVFLKDKYKMDVKIGVEGCYNFEECADKILRAYRKIYADPCKDNKTWRTP